MTRLEREASIVTGRFPAGTQRETCGGVTGWRYSFRDHFGSAYTMFAYHDGSGYSVLVVFPEVQGKYSPSNGHLYTDGRICFGAVMPTLDGAYAKSVLWANGFTAFLATGHFQFSSVG